MASPETEDATEVPAPLRPKDAPASLAFVCTIGGIGAAVGAGVEGKGTIVPVAVDV